jgi:hypothetical protein
VVIFVSMVRAAFVVLNGISTAMPSTVTVSCTEARFRLAFTVTSPKARISKFSCMNLLRPGRSIITV